MKLRIFISILFFLFFTQIHSTIHHIKQDGSGNFTTIQEGINASVDTDTVLVYPGTYYENIDYLEKSLTVASLYMITPEDSLINQTIIDGNEQFRSVTIDECLSASLIGFTIQNGYALQVGVANSYQGGGILIKDVTNLSVSNCVIKNNKSYYGGGIYISYCNHVELIANSIICNRAIRRGGGIDAFGNELNLVFNSESLNNIYLNYAATGSDISIPLIQYSTNIIVDTFTVINPDYFFITGADSSYTFSCLNSKIDEIDQDLYVAPDGNDENNGLSTDDPLQTLACAQTLIKRNDENPNTIHLAPGIYSPSLNNQIYPLNVKCGVIIKGASPDETILDAEFNSPFVYQFNRSQTEFAKLVMEDLKMINGDSVDDPQSGGINIYQADLYLNNVIFENCYGYNGGAVCTSNGFAHLNNVLVEDNYGGGALSFPIEYNCPNPVRNVTIKNSRIINNHPSIFEPDFHAGGALKISGHFDIPGDYMAQLVNCEITGNHDNYYNPNTALGGAVVLLINNSITIDILNCTFGNNTLEYDTGSSFYVVDSQLDLFNSILYNNEGYSMNIFDGAEVNIYYSLIEGGNTNVNYYGSGSVNWLEGNLDENPMFESLGTYPFALSANSPCIDAGTLDLPAGIELPQFDLAGNPRIYGNTIDMGAYEWQGVGIEEPENPHLSPLTTHLSNFPNPFNPSTTIKLELAEAGKIELAVYNIKGQKVKTLLDCTTAAGTFNCIWNGKDSSSKRVSSGEYIVKLNVNGEEKAVHKIMLLK